MEQTHLNESEQTALQELSVRAREEFGEDAEFTYDNMEGKYFTLTLDQALKVCGEHIATVSTDMALGMLSSMHQMTVRMQTMAETNPEAKERYEATKERGRQELARRALAQED